MIKEISVNGFRTLSDFKFELQPGLNLLVGPNGGGKTTMLMFFSFLNDIFTTDLSNALSNVGGAGRIFRKIGKDDFERTIKAEIVGAASLEEQDFMRSSKADLKDFGANLYYKYSFSIQLANDREDVFFASQELLLKRTRSEVKTPSKIKNWDVKIRIEVDPDGKQLNEWKYLSGNASKKLRPEHLMFDDKTPEKLLDDMIGDNHCLLHITRFFGGDLRAVFLQDFGRRALYNPQPDLIRKPEDSAKSPGIRPDGSGLYATLLALKRKKKVNPRIAARKRLPSDVPFMRYIPLQRIVEFFRFAFPQLYSIEIANDPFDNQIRARVTLDSKEGPQLPLAALSDGTLKWMSLATALLTTRHVTGIEEPENFIHPTVQQQAIELIRDNTNKNGFVLVSSHSQSILDAARPDEIVIVTLKDSRTIARRIKDPNKIQKLIYDSGFNLSFYYMSGALQDA